MRIVTTLRPIACGLQRACSVSAGRDPRPEVRENRAVNFARDVIDAADPSRRALVALGADGARTELTFGEVSQGAARLAGTLAGHGVDRGDVVMTVIGNRPEWVLALLACFRLGAVALPCTPQLRAADLRARMDAAEPALVLAGEQDADVVRQAAFTGRCSPRPSRACWSPRQPRPWNWLPTTLP